MAKQPKTETLKRFLLKRCEMVEARHTVYAGGFRSVSVIIWHAGQPFVGTGKTEAAAFRAAKRAFDSGF